MNRGCITDEIQKLARDYLGREITTRELRLYPFIDYCLKNGGYMSRDKIDDEEVDIIHSYDEKTQLKRDFQGYIWVSESFYNYIQSVLWHSYVDYKLK